MKCLVLGYYGAKNLGDDMMLYALIDWLKSQGRDVCVISECPSETKSRFEVESIQNTPLLLQWGWVGSILKGRAFKLLKQLYNADELLVGGGDLIRDTQGWKVFFYTIEKLIIAQLLGKPTYLVSVGVTLPTKKYSLFILKHLLPRCKHIIARDERTMRFCKKIGVQNISLAPDVATRIPKLLNIKKKNKNPKSKYTCLITLRASPNAYQQYNIGEQHYERFAEAIDKFIEFSGADVQFSPYQEVEGGGDNAVHRQVFKYIKNKEKVEILEWCSIADAFNRVAKADLVVGMRLHTLIVGVSLNVPCIAMPYDTKLTEFCDLAGVTEIISPELMLDPNRLSSLMLKNLNAEPKYTYMNTKSWDSLQLEFTE